MEKQIACVSGGTGGIGTAICQALAKEGFRVIATFREADKTQAWLESQRAQGFDFGTVQVDVRNFQDCQALIDHIQTTEGGVHVLVNNAGITRDTQLKNMSLEQWQDVLQTNLDSIFNLSRAAITLMLNQRYGRIINISSINGQKGQFGQTNYCASKAGMHGFTMALAQETARHNITVNTLSPGYIATEMVMAVPEAIREKIISQIPVGRLGKPEEIARMVAFLASPESGFITGANFAVNGGQYMH